jgi:small subunit ribosomal protein S4
VSCVIATAAKYKLDRRMGENVFGRPKSPVNKREYGPGQHGQRRKNKLSDFGTQLRAKQKLKGYYGDLTEKQFKRIYAEAARVKGDTGENLSGFLERRLDAVVFRAKFVPTIWAARQFVNHAHVLVNGKSVNIPSYRVKEGDVIEVRQKSKQLGSCSRPIGARRAGRARLPRGRPQQDDRDLRAPARSPTCPTRSSCSPRSSSSSTPRRLTSRRSVQGARRERIAAGPFPFRGGQ